LVPNILKILFTLPQRAWLGLDRVPLARRWPLSNEVDPFAACRYRILTLNSTNASGCLDRPPSPCGDATPAKTRKASSSPIQIWRQSATVSPTAVAVKHHTPADAAARGGNNAPPPNTKGNRLMKNNFTAGCKGVKRHTVAGAQHTTTVRATTPAKYGNGSGDKQGAQSDQRHRRHKA
jgi:hypothetical protein